MFQAGSTLTTATASQVNLINGASPCNVYWQIGSSATLGTASTFRGSIFALQSITVTTGVTVHGRVLARNGAVTLDTDTITRPNCAVTPPRPDRPVDPRVDRPVDRRADRRAVPPAHGPTTPSGPGGPDSPAARRPGGPDTTPPQITQFPSGPPQTGDGGSLHTSHPVLAATGVLALLASMASVVLWRREDRGA